MGTTALVLAIIEDDVSGTASTWPWPTRCRPSAVASTAPSPSRCSWPTVDGHRPGHPVGALRSGPEVRRGPRSRLPGRRVVGADGARALGGGAPRAGDRSGPGGPPGRLGGQAPAPRGLPGAPRPATGTTAGWPPSICSTTTCGPRGRLFARLDTERLVDPDAVAAAVTEPPRRHPGLLPGAVPQAVGRVGGQRQLGFHGLRPRNRPPAARPYDGSAAWNSGTCRGVAGRDAPRRRSCWSG